MNVRVESRVFRPPSWVAREDWSGQPDHLVAGSFGPSRTPVAGLIVASDAGRRRSSRNGDAEVLAKAIVEAATQGERDLHRLREAGLAAVGHAGSTK
jgi:hypothetical protein